MSALTPNNSSSTESQANQTLRTHSLQARSTLTFKRLVRDSAANDDGATLIEMAVTLSTLFALLFCFMEICLALYSQNMISELAREGTRYAMTRGASCPTSASPTCEVNASQVDSYVSAIGLPNLAGGTMTVATTYPNGNEAVGSTVQVKITYVFPIYMPFVPNPSFTLTSTSVMAILQ